jgi:hypothetical protein
MPRRVEPRPLKQHQLKTVLLRVPTLAWPTISTGRASEFRAATGNVPQLWNVPLPALVVAYRRQLSKVNYDYRLMVMEGVRQEALGTISEEGLRRAGYAGDDALAHFRRDWMVSEKKRFEPLRKVFVFTVRPFEHGDISRVGESIINHLYGDYLVQEAHKRSRTIQVRDPAAGSSRGREAASVGSR